MAIDRYLLTEKVSGQENVLPGHCCPPCQVMTNWISPSPGKTSQLGWPAQPRCWPRQAITAPIPQADTDLQHVGEPQEAGSGGGGHVETAGVEVSLNNMEWNAYQVAKNSG